MHGVLHSPEFALNMSRLMCDYVMTLPSSRTTDESSVRFCYDDESFKRVVCRIV